MAEDLLEVEEFFDLHPCDVPYGMENYVLNDLTTEQQMQLNEMKRNEIRTNQKYLAEHPEVCT